jgi:hypothetical protein
MLMYEEDNFTETELLSEGVCALALLSHVFRLPSIGVGTNSHSPTASEIRSYHTFGFGQ